MLKKMNDMKQSKLIMGNWKMNLTHSHARDLLTQLKLAVTSSPSVKVVFATPSIYLRDVLEMGLNAAAQDCSMYSSGAYTGEISAHMLASIGVSSCLVAHSERRQYHHETNSTSALKITQCLQNGVTPVYCCGESKEERLALKHFDVVESQLREALTSVDVISASQMVIAYEPVWAIGTGLTASAEQAQEMHSFIRNVLGDIFNGSVSTEIKILYGGSVNAGNAGNLMVCKDIDGALVGGASLKADDFMAIISSAR
jgi:triosephosphate isomerase